MAELAQILKYVLIYKLDIEHSGLLHSIFMAASLRSGTLHSTFRTTDYCATALYIPLLDPY